MFPVEFKAIKQIINSLPITEETDGGKKSISRLLS